MAMKPEQPSSREPRPTAAFLFTGLGSMLVSLDVSVANSLLPAIGRDYDDAGNAWLSWVITAYAIAFASALVPCGRLADRNGRRRVFLTGSLMFAAASLVCGLAPDLPVLIAGRVLQGVGAAALSPASLALLMHAVPVSRRALYTARWAGMGAVGIGCGPLVGGLATDTISWRWAFLINIPIVAVVVIGGRRSLPETALQEGSRFPDPAGIALLAGGTALLTLVISEIDEWGLVDPRFLVAAAAAVAALSLFGRRSLRVTDPVLDLKLLRDRHVAAVTAVTLAYSAGFFGVLFSFVAFLVGPWHLSLVRAGLALLPMAGVVAVLTLAVGHLAAWTGFRLPIMTGALLMTTGLLLQSRFVIGHHFTARWPVIVSVIGLGIGLCYPLIGAAAVSGIDPRLFAAASAVNQCARQVGAAIGVASMVAVLGTRTSIQDFRIAWLVTAVLCGIAAAAALLIKKQVTEGPGATPDQTGVATMPVLTEQ